MSPRAPFSFKIPFFNDVALSFTKPTILDIIFLRSEMFSPSPYFLKKDLIYLFL